MIVEPSSRLTLPLTRATGKTWARASNRSYALRLNHAFALLAVVIAVMLPTTAPAATNSITSAAAPNRKPNIVLIMADDLGYGSLGCYGSPTIKTPNIDRLASDGVRFTDFHSNGTVCSPTRASLLTGRYPQRCAWVADADLSPIFQEQRRQNPSQRWAWGISAEEVTIAGVLRRAGYRTGIVGKWHLGYDFKFHPMNYGFDEFRGFMGGNVDYHTHVAGYGLKQLDWWNGRDVENEDGYTTELLTKYATDFIARNQDRPFFLYVAQAAPHDPWQSHDPAQKKSQTEIYREMIEGLDASVGTIVAALRRHDLEKNTLVIFCSDNGGAAPRGFPANGRLQGRKGGMQEGGHRVPFIAAWSGMIKAGTTNGAVAVTMDFFPTFAKLAGATAPAGHVIDGLDLMPQLVGASQPPERTLHWLFGNNWAVRRGPWKLMKEGEKPLSLVNVEADLAEANNQANEKTGLVAELSALHRDWIESVGNK
jgi:arylsulfatase A-like enzyme